MEYDYITKEADWPIHLATKNRDMIRELVINDAHLHLLRLYPHRDELRDVLERTIYSEQYRIKNQAWKVDPKDDKKFWKSIANKVYETDPVLMDEAYGEHIEHRLLKDIIRRYTNEIMGKFRPDFYKFTAKAAPFLFGRLFTAPREDIRNFFVPQTLLKDKLVNIGPIEKIRKLSTKGTLILLPTHFSNLDSMMIGYGIANMGLPPFQYAAGLNLFNSKVFGYFMERLGAYKLDRRKKNPIYLQTLKSFSRNNILQGVHTLFFPGGTRSRSGAIESHLKLGLVGTAIEAQRMNCEANPENPEKIFMIPLCMSYHFVLEAASLIEEHLKKTGKEQYITIDDEFSQFDVIMKFLWHVYKETSEITLSFGDPVDVFGNAVDMDGRSIDKRGNEINISHFFTSNGKIVEDLQREQEYTRLIGERLIEDFHRINVVYASHLVAFVAFQILFKEHPKADIYSFLKIPVENLKIDYARFKSITSDVMHELLDMRKSGKLLLAPHMEKKIEEVIDYGFKNIGVYHAFTPLGVAKDVVYTENLKTLYFYHNRLAGYGLDRVIKLK